MTVLTAGWFGSAAWGCCSGDGADGVEGLVTSVAFCEIDGWCNYYFWGPGDGQGCCCCEIDGRVLGGMQFGDSCAGVTIFLRCCLVLVEVLFGQCC